MVQLIFRSSPISVGVLVFGMMVTDSSFQFFGHCFVAIISLYMLVSGTASRSAYLVTRSVSEYARAHAQTHTLTATCYMHADPS